MKDVAKVSWISALSGGFGGMMGAFSGSNSKLVVVIVSIVFALLCAWSIRGWFK